MDWNDKALIRLFWAYFHYSSKKFAGNASTINSPAPATTNSRKTLNFSDLWLFCFMALTDTEKLEKSSLFMNKQEEKIKNSSPAEESRSARVKRLILQHKNGELSSMDILLAVRDLLVNYN